ncbi:MAG: TonB-dependent receptor [Bacteroidales bacterium]|jgi:hypothetical protein|nr:TonB-dependent receptor [Bacteroidales bacterium]
MSSVITILLTLLLYPATLGGNGPDTVAVQDKVTISGFVRDAGTGEMLVGVTVIETSLKIGAATDEEGFYSLTLPAGTWELQLSYIGYVTLTHKVNTVRNLKHDFVMESSETMLDGVVIEGKRRDENVRAPATGVVNLDVKTIAAVPSLLGEVDLIKVLQLLPGVQPTSEGSTGFSVRGGGSDQNLILLDEATLYNASHLLGFFSVFNNDVVKDVTLYKGDIPAIYGGRLSSLLDVEMKEGDLRKIRGAASIGTISSKLTIGGPVIKDRTTFLVAGRRTYADIFLPLANNEDIRDNRLYFYDLNMKLSHVINKKNRLYLTAYEGKDVFRNQFSSVSFGNRTATLRWNHFISEKLLYNVSLIYSRYNYNLGTPEEGTGAFSFNWDSRLSDYSSKVDFTHLITGKHKLRYGASIIFHEFFPGEVKGIGSSTGDSYFRLDPSYALESGIYASDEYRVNGRLTLKYGLRLAIFQNIGPGTLYEYDNDYNPVDSIKYSRGEIFNSFASLEPRLAFTWLLDENSSLKGSYGHMAQYIALAQNSASGTPLDIWFPASPNVEPQMCDQFAAGYFRNFGSDTYEASLEAYYKNYLNLIDFRDHAQLFLNQYLEGELRRGNGYSFGIEALVRKNEGTLTGWVSYTYSRSFRKVPEINNGNRYPSLYDKPHAISIVANYMISGRISASATWTYATGLPLTLPTGRAVIGNSLIPVYSDRNSYRMEDYHRLDLSVTLRGKVKPEKKWHGELNLSVYNVYNRHNTWSINFVQEEDNPYATYAEKTYLFSVIPALTYNIKF